MQIFNIKMREIEKISNRQFRRISRAEKMSDGKSLTTIVNKYPTYRDEAIKGCWKWFKGRRVDDNAESLWRIHDKLYDLKKFEKIHPGGREWLSLSEVFMTHHKMYKIRFEKISPTGN